MTLNVIKGSMTKDIQIDISSKKNQHLEFIENEVKKGINMMKNLIMKIPESF